MRVPLLGWVLRRLYRRLAATQGPPEDPHGADFFGQFQTL